MTRYYIDLKDYAETADIKTVGDDTLKEVVKDFTKELQERALNIDDVSKQRELLLAFDKWCEKAPIEDSKLTNEQFVDKYLSQL